MFHRCAISRILFCQSPVVSNQTKVASIISLHNVLPQDVKPSTRPQPGTCIGDLFEVAARRDCPFHPIFFNRFVTVALIVGSPRPVISRYAVPCSPDFPPIFQRKSAMLCSSALWCILSLILQLSI